MAVLWQKPKLQDHHPHQHRKVSWLELFWDLIFVVVIAQLAHHLALHPSAHALGDLVFCLVPVWLIWNGTTYYNERFETEGLESRLQFFVLIALVAALASFTADPLGLQFVGFAGAYLAARGVNIALWLWAARHHPEFRPSSMRFALGYGVSVACVLVAALRPEQERMLWWGLGLVAEFVGPLLSVWHSRNLPDFSSSKLPERMGLFVIIVLGESLASLVRGLQGQLAQIQQVLPALLALVVGFLGWWIYFDFVGRRTERRSNLWTWVWSYLHAPLVLSIAAFGALLDPILRQDPHASPWFLGAVASFLILIALIEWTLKHYEWEPAGFWTSPMLKLACALLLFVLVALHLEPLVALGCAVFGMAIPALYGLWVWRKYLKKA